MTISMKRAGMSAAIFFIVALSASSDAQNIDQAAGASITYRTFRALKPPVTSQDISDRPYRVVGRIETLVRKATVFDGRIDEAKAYQELWERAVKLGADGVVHASVGKPKILALGPWGARTATGDAIRFID